MKNNLVHNNKLNKSFVSIAKNSGLMFSTMPNQFEPIRKDLFSIEFPIQMNIPETFQVSASRPKISHNIVPIKYKNLETKYKGKTTIENMTIVFRDAIGPSLYSKLLQWSRECTDFATGKGGYAATYKKTLTLNLEDPTGTVIQKWKLYGCILASIDGGELTMEDDGIAMITIEIAMDSAELLF